MSTSIISLNVKDKNGAYDYKYTSNADATKKDVGVTDPPFWLTIEYPNASKPNYYGYCNIGQQNGLLSFVVATPASGKFNLVPMSNYFPKFSMNINSNGSATVTDNTSGHHSVLLNGGLVDSERNFTFTPGSTLTILIP